MPSTPPTARRSALRADGTATRCGSKARLHPPTGAQGAKRAFVSLRRRARAPLTACSGWSFCWTTCAACSASTFEDDRPSPGRRQLALVLSVSAPSAEIFSRSTACRARLRARVGGTQHAIESRQVHLDVPSATFSPWRFPCSICLRRGAEDLMLAARRFLRQALLGNLRPAQAARREPAARRSHRTGYSAVSSINWPEMCWVLTMYPCTPAHSACKISSRASRAAHDHGCKSGRWRRMRTGS